MGCSQTTITSKGDKVKSELKQARIESGLTALQLAEIAGTNEARIYQVERGRFRPRPDEAQRLADVLRIPVESLFPNGVQTKGGPL
ncbi:MAG TPA: helix-turn-helix transcriptional regulator [Kiritimatiellia bacterium]|nr:helix-turn-helix transcriptional regulator [Kiritimatiellia bacterium]